MSLLIAIISVLWLAAGLVSSLGSEAIIEQTVENGREIQASFVKAAAFVDDFRRDYSRLPSSSEFKEWSSDIPPKPYSANGMELIVSGFPKALIEQFGNPPEGAYALSIWRGEWEEHYASWTHSSSVALDVSEYYVLGSAARDALAVMILFVALCVTAVKLWPGAKHRCVRDSML